LKLYITHLKALNPQIGKRWQLRFVTKSERKMRPGKTNTKEMAESARQGEGGPSVRGRQLPLSKDSLSLVSHKLQ